MALLSSLLEEPHAKEQMSQSEVSDSLSLGVQPLTPLTPQGKENKTKKKLCVDVEILLDSCVSKLIISGSYVLNTDGEMTRRQN